jgi:hypothetical protein
MNDLQTLWALATGTFPVLSVDDRDAVYDTYGPAFGPWLEVSVEYHDGPPVAVLAAGAGTDPVAALTAAAADWRRLSDDDRVHRMLPTCPPEPTVADVVLRAPHGLLVRHGLVRLWGVKQGQPVRADLPLEVPAPRKAHS